MLRKYTFLRIVFTNNNHKTLKFSTFAREKWDLSASVCLERKPIITKGFNNFESNYFELLNKIEFEMSHKSDHEIKKIKDKLIAEELKKESSLIDSDQISMQTAQEFEDLCTKELKMFKFASRTTKEDMENNLTSTNRQLNNSLLLIVKQNIGKTPIWLLPQGIHKEGETMRQTAERVLKEICGDNLHTKFLGNAPCGFYKYRYPRKANASSIGMKIFFFKALLLGGHVSTELCSEFQWIPQNKLDLLKEDYLKSLKMFLLEDEESELRPISIAH